MGALVDLAREGERPLDVALRDAVLGERVRPEAVLRVGVGGLLAFLGGRLAGDVREGEDDVAANRPPATNAVADFMREPPVRGKGGR